VNGSYEADALRVRIDGGVLAELVATCAELVATCADLRRELHERAVAHEDAMQAILGLLAAIDWVDHAYQHEHRNPVEEGCIVAAVAKAREVVGDGAQ
jgi:hypothetical protein